MRREIRDAETARKLARVIEAIRRGEPLDRAAAYGSLEKRVVVRFLETLKGSLEGWMEGAGSAAPDTPGKPHTTQELGKPRAPLKRKKLGRLTAFTDGASRGNPGRAACAVVLFDEKNEELLRRTKLLGVTTNNVAEYEGVILALDYAEALGARALEVRLDSELVVRQLKGEYKVKHPALRKLHARVVERIASFGEVTVVHVPREETALADGLANDELDGRADGTTADPEEIRGR